MKSNIVYLLSIIMLSSALFAWDDCPFGQVNDTYPGDCGRYVDTNGDAVCDKSQLEPAGASGTAAYVAEEGSGLEKIANLTGIPVAQLTLGKVADYYGVDREQFVSEVKKNFNLSALSEADYLLPLHDNYKVCAEELMLIGTKLSGNASASESLYLEYSGTEIKAMTVSQVASAYGISEAGFLSALKSEYNLASLAGSDQFQLLHDNYGVTPSRVKEIALSLKGGVQAAAPTSANQTGKSALAPQPQAIASAKPLTYDYWWLTALILFAYSATYFAAYTKHMTMFLHRKIWNAFLALFAIAVSFTGIYLVLRVNWGFYIEFPFNFMQIHVATGIAFVIIALFHAAWHIPYFKGYLPLQNDGKGAKG